MKDISFVIHISSIIINGDIVTNKFCTNIIKMIKKKETSTIHLDKRITNVKFQRCVNQGDNILPYVFTTVLKKMFMKQVWENKGIKIN